MASAAKPKALILGVTGQDGAHLAASLLYDGWEVFGGFRAGAPAKLWRLNHLGIAQRIRLFHVDITDPLNLLEAFRSVGPDQIYHLAGESFVADSFKRPALTIDANVIGAINVLEAMRREAPEARLFMALSSEVFGHPGDGKLTEESARRPTNPYGVSKQAVEQLARVYRESYGLFVASGLMFNHEGPLRARSYVTRKITFNLARLKYQSGDAMNLGLLGASRDWGAAEDYVEGMRAMLSLDQGDDFILATGKLTSIRDFIRSAAQDVGFDPQFEGDGKDEVCRDASGLLLAQVSEAYLRPFDTPPMRGDASKLSEASGWKPSYTVDRLAREMVQADLKRWEQGQTDV